MCTVLCRAVGLGCCNHRALLKPQMKPAAVGDTRMHGAVLVLLHKKGPKPLSGTWVARAGAVEGSGRYEGRGSGLGGHSTGQRGFVSRSPEGSSSLPFLTNQPAGVLHTYLHLPFLCALLVELYGERKET